MANSRGATITCSTGVAGLDAITGSISRGRTALVGGLAGTGKTVLTLQTANLAAFCERYLDDKHEIEVVDVLQEPARALLDGVLLTPMLSILSGRRVHRLVGNLSDSSRLLAALGIDGGST